MKPKTVDEYIKSKPGEAQNKLRELRDILKTAVPDTAEALKWGEPAILDPDGMILAVYAAYKEHMNLVVTPSTLQAFIHQLTGYKTGKGSIQFTYDKPLPAELIQRIILYRYNEYKKHGIKWR